MREYQGTFTDSSGEDPAIVRFDATTIGFTTRGVAFTGGPDRYRPDLPYGSPALASFTFQDGSRTPPGGEPECEPLLAEFKLCWGMPVGVEAGGREYPGELRVIYHLLDPGGACTETENGSHATANLIDLALFYSYHRHSVTSGGDFRTVLHYLIVAMGHGAHLKACIACAYGDYPPSGHAPYGSMLCFRNLKEAYRAIADARAPDSEACQALSLDPRVLRTGELYVCEEFRGVSGS